MLPSIKVHLADGDHLLGVGLQSLLSSTPNIKLDRISSNGQKAIEQVSECPPDILLIETNIRETNFRETIKRVSRAAPDTKVVVLSADHSLETMLFAYDSGAHSFLSKSSVSSELDAMLRLIHSGSCVFSKPEDADRFPLSGLVNYELRALFNRRTNDREKAILGAVVNGYSNAQIASLLHVSEGIVKAHIARIMAPLNISNRVQLAVRVIQAGLDTDARNLIPLKGKTLSGGSS